MLPLLLLGLLLLIGALLIGKWFVEADPKSALTALFWTVGLVVLALFLFLAVTGRLALAAATLGALIPWAVKLTKGLSLVRGLAAAAAVLGLAGGGGGIGGAGLGGKQRPRPGGASQVRTDFLAMTLDHDSGDLSGEVLAGSFAGSRLSALSEPDLRALAAELAGDPDSAALLESWLDRAHPGWRETQDRETSAAGASGASPPPGAVSREEALAILGLEDGADAEAVRAAHHRLMRRLHPDAGGSDWMAAKLNQARDRLLR